MESKITTEIPPVGTFEEEGNKALEVFRLEEGIEPLNGPYVVGGRASADCFRYSGQLQAGRDRTASYEPLEPGEPTKSEW